MISFDTETTGVDFHHGAAPFLVTIREEGKEPGFFEWDVDPRTRKVLTNREEVEEAQSILDHVDEVVLHNARFDAKAWDVAGGNVWDWGITHDTLMAGHLLASSERKDLTSMVLDYLGYSIQPFEDATEVAVKEIRTKVQQARAKHKRQDKKRAKALGQGKLFEEEGATEEELEIAQWYIASAAMEDNPSARDETWKFDLWLPRAYAKFKNLPKTHPYWTVTSKYACADSFWTLELWKRLDSEIERRGLREIYEERLKLLPIIYDMQDYGVTYYKPKMEGLKANYAEVSEVHGNRCIGIARTYDLDLTLPKAGNNGSLLQAAEVILEDYARSEVNKVEPMPRPHTLTGPSLDKDSLEIYLSHIPEKHRAHKFFFSLREKRKRDTSITYINGYSRFGIALPDCLDYICLHPSLNPTGSNTLRFTCSNPNEQNISKRGMYQGDKDNLRSGFGPPPGYEWFSNDAENIELRLPAYESKEKKLIELFERPNDPPYFGSNHLLIFSILWPEMWAKYGAGVKDEFGDSFYQWVKNGNFAVQYGAVDREDGEGTADRAYHQKGAQKRIASMFSELTKLQNYYVEFAKRHGYVETIPDRSICPDRGYPIMCTRTEWGKIRPTVPFNYHVQSSAMWWMSKGMRRCWDQFREWEQKEGFKGRIVMQIHDEMVFEMPKAPVGIQEAMEIKDKKHPRYRKSNLWRIQTLRRLMEQGGDDYGIPTPVTCKWHDNNWSEGVKIGRTL